MINHRLLFQKFPKSMHQREKKPKISIQPVEEHTATLEVKPPTEPTTTERPDAPGLLNRKNMSSQIFE